MNIVFMSQFRDSSGYASAARGYVRALDSYLKNNPSSFSLKLFTIKIEEGSKISANDDEVLKKYEFQCSEEISEYTRKEYLILWYMPAPLVFRGDHTGTFGPQWFNVKNLIENSAKNINMSTWEASSLPKDWNFTYKRYNTKSIIVPSKWNVDVYSECFKEQKCYYLPYVVDEDIIAKPKSSNLISNLENKFVIFSLSQWINRKGFDKLIRSYCMEFKDQKDVVLLIKTYGQLIKAPGAPSIESQNKAIMQEAQAYKNSVFLDNMQTPKTSILIIPDVLPYEQISSIYQRADLFALLTRGEGFSLPTMEALLHKTPVMVPDKGGHIDYIHHDAAYFVEGHWSPYINRPEYTCDMNWYEPHVLSARKGLRHAYELWKSNKKELEKKGEIGYNHVRNMGFDKDSIGKKLFDILYEEYMEISKINFPISDIRKEISNFPIKERTRSLKNIIKNLKTYKEKIMCLKDVYKGEECYVLTCGPSLNEYDKEYLKEKLKDKLVVSIKQTYQDFKDIVDIHLFNSCNYTPFQYDEYNSPIAIGCAGELEFDIRQTTWRQQEMDIFLKIACHSGNKKLSDTLAIKKDFDNWTFDKTISRPWGPGLMYEVVFYLLEYLGVSKIYTIGWDLEQPGTTKSNHYYQNENINIIRKADPMSKREIEFNIETSKEFYNWLKKKDIDLLIATQNSHVHESIPRAKV